MENKKIVWIDMDGVLVDFGGNLDKWLKNNRNLVHIYKRFPDRIPGIFRNPEPVEGAIDAIQKLYDSDLYDLRILTTAPWGNPEAWMHKRLWVEKYLGKSAHKRLILSHNKHLNRGHFLIDDRLANGAGQFEGEHIHFGSTDFPNWASVLQYLLP